MNAVTHTPGRVVWRELMTSDLERAKGFYGELFGWVFKDFPMSEGQPPYPIAHVGDKGIAGLMQKPSPEMPSFWLSYVSVKDVDEAVGKAKASGGSALFGPMDVPEVGRLGMIADFDNAVIGLLRSTQGDQAPEGMPQMGEFCWETMSSTDPERAKAFYSEVFGWTQKPGPSGNGDVVFGAEEAMVADLQQAQPGTPSMWLTYVVVDDLGRARERVKQLGGAVVVPLIEVPNVGNIALIADPTGGHIGLFEAPKG
ncbi:MAG: VOC family protein [Myxococcales bacterium]|nr:VOC family protein [Myxococcales bacterium]